MNFFQAFFSGKLRHNDYQIIFSIGIGHIALILCALAVCLEMESCLGITICIPIAHYAMAIFALIKVLSTDTKMSCMNYFWFFFSYALQYGWGVANLFITYNSEERDPSTPGEASAGSYIVVYLIVIPFVTSCITAIAKWIDDKGKVSAFFII